MIITNCAVCAAPLAHEAPRCVRCKTRYCNSTCQHDHLRRGHKQICKKIQRGGNAEQYYADKKTRKPSRSRSKSAQCLIQVIVKSLPHAAAPVEYTSHKIILCLTERMSREVGNVMPMHEGPVAAPARGSGTSGRRDARFGKTRQRCRPSLPGRPRRRTAGRSPRRPGTR